MKLILKVIIALIPLGLVVYGSSFVAGILAAAIGVELHWSATAIVWCERVVQFAVIFGFIYGA